MIPDYDPNQYVEIAHYSQYCEMHPTDNDSQEKKDTEKLEWQITFGRVF